MSLELVRVRVLFLEPGNKVSPEHVESGLDDELNQWTVEALKKEGYARAQDLPPPSPHDLITSDCDSVVMLKPLTFIYFDTLGCGADWEHSWMDEAVSCSSYADIFGDIVPDLITYAKLLARRTTSEWGTKVNFLTVWSCWSHYNAYDGDWDSGEEFAGILILSNSILVPGNAKVVSLEEASAICRFGVPPAGLGSQSLPGL